MKTFNARFDSQCEWCLEGIETGELVAYWKSDVLHANCAEEAEREEKHSDWKEIQ